MAKMAELFLGDWRSASFEGASLVVADVDKHDTQQLAGKTHAAGAFIDIIDKRAPSKFYSNPVRDVAGIVGRKRIIEIDLNCCKTGGCHFKNSRPPIDVKRSLFR